VKDNSGHFDEVPVQVADRYQPFQLHGKTYSYDREWQHLLRDADGNLTTRAAVEAAERHRVVQLRNEAYQMACAARRKRER
jgi:hypothetical protein